MAALEAIIYAVEKGRIPLKRVEDALARQLRVKERFLAPPRPRPATGAALRAILGQRRAPGRRRRDGEVRRSRMLKPRALRPGDRIAVVAPASSFARDVVRRRRRRARGAWATSRSTTTPCSRASATPRATRRCAPRPSAAPGSDPSIAALIAVRGGYGSVQLLPLLDPDEIRRTPKAFIGYSDNTSLLAWLTGHCGMVVVSRPDARRPPRERGGAPTTATRSPGC